MLYEYAVDPSLLGDINNCRTIFDNFKPERGKLIADVPRKWQQAAFSAINGIPHAQCQPVMRKTLKKHLGRLLKESLCANRNPPQWNRIEESWLTHVLAAQGAHPYAAILAARTSQELACTYALSELLLNAPDCWRSPTQRSVLRNADNIVDALMPLLRISKQITLIDRHLYPGETRYRRVLVELVRRIPEMNFGRGVGSMTMHVSDQRHDMRDSLQLHLGRHLPRGFEIVCCGWPKSAEHDRFAITDVGGIQLGQGFDEHSPAGTEHVFLSLIDYETRRRLMTQFSEQPTYRERVSGPS